MSYIKDERMLNLIKNKRIAIVGPSPHLLGTNLGSYIDKYDLICRVNTNIYPSGYEKDYGSRTDILSFCGDSRFLINYEKVFELNKENIKNIKIVFLSTIKAQHNWGGSVVENFKKVNKNYNLPYDYIGKNNYQLACNKFGVEPNSGQMTIWMLLQYPIKELFIAGFSFYEQFKITGDNKSSFYNHDMLYPVLQLPVTHNPLVGHSQEQQKKYFINQLYTYSSIIKIDSYLNDLLNTNHHNIKELNKIEPPYNR